MGLEVVLNEILNRGAEEERQLVAKAEAERRKILDAAEGEADELRAKALQDTRLRVEALQREQRSAAEFEARRRYLQAQRDLTEDFRTRVLADLAKMPRARREKVLGLLVAKVQPGMPKGLVHAPTDDLAIVAKLAPGWSKGETPAGAGGFQVETHDRTVVLDNRFETLLDNAWRDVLAASRDLFEA